jgi:hypothetical protein
VGIGKKGSKVKDSPLFSLIINSLRLSHQEAESTVIVMRGAVWMLDLVQKGELQQKQQQQQGYAAELRRELGLCLRMCGPLWVRARVLAQAASQGKFRQELDLLYRLVFELQLDGVWKMKALLNGNEIAKLLQINPGPIFSVLTAKLIEEQLKRPSLTIEEAQAFLMELYKNSK